MIHNEQTLHTLTHNAMDTLRMAYGECANRPVEGRILSAMLTVKQVHDMLQRPDSPELLDPEEYCAAI